MARTARRVRVPTGGVIEWLEAPISYVVVLMKWIRVGVELVALPTDGIEQFELPTSGVTLLLEMPISSLVELRTEMVSVGVEQ
jgi:hypothetical protein